MCYFIHYVRALTFHVLCPFCVYIISCCLSVALKLLLYSDTQVALEGITQISPSSIDVSVRPGDY